MTLREKFFGDRNFYKKVIAVALPIMLQNGITNFVSLLDNIMVGRLGTDAMSGVAIVNQLMFVFSISVFGGVSGASIFGAQFHGRGDSQGVRNTFRFKMMTCALVVLVGFLLFFFLDEELISLYLHQGGDTGSIPDTLAQARGYLRIMLWTLVPFALSQCYASTLRDTGETMVPMKAGLLALFVNLGLNYVLIFGKLGFPALGVRGAAIATVAARYVECFVIVRWTHANEDRNHFAIDLYRGFRVPSALVKKIVRRGTPLMCNEIFWSAGMAILAQCYSMRGLAVMAGNNIANTVINLFNIVFIAMGGAIGIMVGNLLGAGKMKEARETDTRLIVFSVLLSLGIGIVVILLAPLFPRLYNTTEEVRSLSTSLIRISAALLPLHAFLHGSYFTLRSGGKTGITFFFDGGFLWFASIPLAFCLSRFTQMPILPMYLLVQAADLLKLFTGYFLVRSDIWVNNLVVEEKMDGE